VELCVLCASVLRKTGHSAQRHKEHRVSQSTDLKQIVRVITGRLHLFNMNRQIIVILFIICGCNPNPECCQRLHTPSDSVRIVHHLKKITKTDGFRNCRNVPLLNETAEYIFSIFSQYADTAYYQPYQAIDETYMNVVCRMGSANDKPLVVVGAHYDVAGDTEGADDNASGVVGLLELVRILSTEKLRYPVEIVAYSLEELWPISVMGSFIHAKSLHDTKTSVYGMIALEMIGYFDDRAKSQSYPVKAMELIYGSKGNYILLAKKFGTGKFVRRFSNSFKKQTAIETKTIQAPMKWGIDRSDHKNYWDFGFHALMITNTANYRNPNYHRSSDTMETLDIAKMMKVIDATALAITNLE